jgi:hypothetical protein
MAICWHITSSSLPLNSSLPTPLSSLEISRVHARSLRFLLRSKGKSCLVDPAESTREVCFSPLQGHMVRCEVWKKRIPFRADLLVWDYWRWLDRTWRKWGPGHCCSGGGASHGAWSCFSPLFWVAYDGIHSKTLPFSCLLLWPLKKEWEPHQGTFQAVLNGLATPLALNVHARWWNYKSMIYATIFIRTSGPHGLEPN